ncbi:hypothetical protein SSS_10353 [Sarcoptes scabiei]|uniref:Uncharacterized protein n=1 Tax=Sarcoptes scabiei TaxID=52283 RepID=A0A131ZXT0_SARSC|nr:hypothetical protein SSS_10353 [Sarcoptes scabiei]KPM03493.1 hypothetical protein QR98_0019260 [Sarcoptes scabiei]UXI20618.1 hypothetical protein NH340_JMT06561 [Sarcoptes scabiei]
MIQQHFIRSPSLREKLNDRYAGLELISGLIIAVVIILAIFFISSISGRILFYLLLLLFLVITLSIALICFVDYQKRQIKQFETNELDRNRSGFNVQGIRFIPVGDYV